MTIFPFTFPESSSAVSASSNKGSFASRCVVAMTRQPSALAIWMAA